MEKFRQMVLCLVVSVVLLTSCNLDEWKEDGPGKPPVVLRGTVTDTYTDQPVPAAEVVVGAEVLTTNMDGHYTTTNWAAEDTLSASAPGYEPFQMALNSRPDLVRSDEMTVTLDLALRPNHLQGKVVDAYSGKPVVGVQVAAMTEPAAGTTGNEVLLNVSALTNTTEVSPTEPSAAPALSPPPAADPRGEGGTDRTGTPPITNTHPADHLLATATTDQDGHYVLNEVPEQFHLLMTAEDYEPIRADVQRQTRYNAEMRPDVLRGTVKDRYSGEGVSGAIVSVGVVSTTTTHDGTYFLKGVPSYVTVVDIRADGYAPLSQQLEQSTTLDAVLRPDELTATLVDRTTGEPISFATIMANTTLTSTAVAYTRIDQVPDGRFVLGGVPEDGYLHVLSPGYRKAVLELKPEGVPSVIALEPFHARALYVKTSTAAYLPERMEEFFEVIDRTELNAMVIDLKSDNLADLGLIYYDSQVPIVQELGTAEDLMDIRGILAEAQRRNIYTIARIHVFSHDNLLAETKPEWAAQTTKPGGCVPNENRRCNGNVFYADWDVAWLDPWNRNVWDYNIQLGVEAAQLGFDEVQFDYIRFPSDATDYEYMVLSKPTDHENNPEAMYETIITVMEEAQDAINRVGAFFSVDVFGYTIWRPEPLIGQNPELMAPYADYICPMVYPSHYWRYEMGFDNAAAHPYEIVQKSLQEGFDMVQNKRAKLRPWLQDFTLLWVPDPLIVEYGPAEVRAQINATEELTYTAGWSLWSADNAYTYDALRPDEGGE